MTDRDVKSAPRLTGRAYWRSVEDYVGTSEFRARAEREFPALATELDSSYREGGPSRRRFLQLMGASIALAGMATMPGCRRKEQKILAYNRKTAEMVPGRAMFYATTMVMAGRVMGILAETHDGRPTKIEGNPLHPASLGATDTFAQASVLDLYDPDRSRTVLKNGQPASFKEDFLAFLESHQATIKQDGGRGLAVLSEDYASPAMEMLHEFMGKSLPNANWHVYEPSQPGPKQAVYQVELAEVIVALDCDLLGLEDDGIRHKRGFASRRRVQKPGDTMNRLYVVEPAFTVTGAAADHRLRLAASAVEGYAEALLAALADKPPVAPGQATLEPLALRGVDQKWIAAVARDLQAHAGRCLVVAGQRQPARVHALVDAINQRLGNVGKTVRYLAPAAAGGINELAGRIQRGEVSTLLILGGNPVFNAPADLEFGELMKRVATRIRLGASADETSAICTWHIPAAHYLESWGDAISSDGTLSPIQPMIDPLFEGKTPLELLARIVGYQDDTGQVVSEPYEIVRGSFARFVKDGRDFEAEWRAFLHSGVYATSQATGVVAPGGAAVAGDGAEPSPQPSPGVPGEGEGGGGAPRVGQATGAGVLTALSTSNLELVFAMSDAVFDGRFANNAWMQECPEPISKLTWDNAALVSPRTAGELQVSTGDIVKIEVGGRSIEIPVFVAPGQAEYSLTLPLGYGRRAAGSIGDGVGVDAYPLRTSTTMGFAMGAKATPTGRTAKLATTQEHWTIADHHVIDEQLRERAIVREGTLEEFGSEPDFAQHMGVHVPKDRSGLPLNIYTPPTLTGAQQWAMVIDLTTCVGCTACTVACQAENNIPVVGKDEVINGREMHWMRLDRYFSGDPDGDVHVSTEPMLCQHCEKAPCEPVCPVNATVHSPEGLNEMVYNRCVGTRYCSNNCPYKVRRFNFFDWNKGTLRQSKSPRDGQTAPDPTKGFSLPQAFQPPMQELLKMQKNPQVTVRMRGVMEKCTYCVQRIEQAKIDARVTQGQNPIERHAGDGPAAVKVADGAIRTACQQACPTQAITFGDKSDPQSQVHAMRQAARNYQVLGHLGVEPRTTYLARLRNVNPELAESRPEAHA